MIERRRPVLTALVAGLVLVLPACGGAPAPDEPAAGATPGFPVSIEHALGTTEIPAAPERVVSLGYTDQDTILALGVVPVAIREFTGGRPSATWPWAADRLQGQQPEVLEGEIGLETIAALDPDLIVAVSGGLTAEQYADFSQLAPVITQPVGDQPFQTGWQDATRLIGEALGRSAQAEELVTGLETRFADAAAEYPQLAGKRAAVAALSSVGGGQYFVWTSEDNRGRFLTSLGLTVPTTFDELAGANFYADISGEQLGLLDETDVLVWLQIPGTENATLEAQAGYAALRIGQEGRVYNMTTEQAVALSFSSVLSLPSLLDTVPAELASRVGG